MVIIIFVIMMSMIIIIMMSMIIIIMMLMIIRINGEYREIFKGVAATGARIWWWAGAALELAGVYDHDHGYNDHNDHYDHYGGDGDSNGGWNDEQVQHSIKLTVFRMKDHDIDIITVLSWRIWMLS